MQSAKRVRRVIDANVLIVINYSGLRVPYYIERMNEESKITNSTNEWGNCACSSCAP